VKRDEDGSSSYKPPSAANLCWQPVVKVGQTPQLGVAEREELFAEES
jgi:hypothetical protein